MGDTEEWDSNQARRVVKEGSQQLVSLKLVLKDERKWGKQVICWGIGWGLSQMGGEHEREMNLNVQSCVE